MSKEIRILILEDVPADVARINHELERAELHFRSKRVATRADFLYELQQHPPDVILSDHGLPSFDGFTALAIAHDKAPEIPFIFVSTSLGDEMTIKALRSGATDYVLKERLHELAPAVQRALRRAEKRAARRMADMDIRQNEDRYRLMIETINEYAIYMLDPAGRVTTWNKGAIRIHRHTAEEMIGNYIGLLFAPEDARHGVPAHLMKRAELEGHVTYENQCVYRDGQQFWVESTLTVLRDENGRLCGFSQVTRRISEREGPDNQIRRLNEELEQRVADRTAQLKATLNELEAFSYSISHDLRAPLLRISGFSDILQNEAASKLDPISLKHLHIIAEGARQMSLLIDALLDFSRMGRAELRYEKLSVSRLVAEARRMLIHETEGREIEWIVGELPDARGDPIMLRQVFVNLISNALKYSRSRRPARIEIGAKDEGGETMYFIRDNGIGFDMKYAHQIFGVFRRLHSTQAFEGTGIGLAHVQRILERHGGRIWAESAPDKGATFHFSIPHPTWRISTHEETEVDPGG